MQEIKGLKTAIINMFNNIKKDIMNKQMRNLRRKKCKP